MRIDSFRAFGVGKSLYRACTATAWLLFGLVASPLQAQDAGDAPVMFVLDGSNSMWGQIDGVAKISIAKDVMSGLIRDWDEQVPVGLIVYGHRRSGDCNDIELVAKPGAIDRQHLLDRVQSISPRGKTPITKSLIAAKSALNAGKGNSAVVLVSDGLETCDGDPCSLAFSYNLINPGFDVHVIGFDVDQAESQALQCIADKSGGRFFRANNAQELQAALQQTVAVATGAPVTPPPVTPAAPPAEPEPSLFLYARLCDDCDRLAAGDVTWQVQSQEGASLYQGLGVLYPGSASLAPGRYPVTARYQSGVLVNQGELVIGDDGQQLGSVNLNGGAAVMSAYASDDRSLAAEPIHYRFYPIRDGKAAAQPLTESAFSGAQVWLPAGRYKVVASHKQIKSDTEIEVIAGQTVQHAFDMRVGYVQPAAVLTEGGEPLGGHVDYAIFKTEANANNSYASGIFMVGAQNAQQPLRPGKYFARVTLKYNRNNVSFTRVFPFDVTANQVARPVFDMQAGLLAHTVASESGKRISNIDYVRESDGKRVAYYNQGSTLTVGLPAGRYYLRVLSARETHKSQSFDVPAGQTTSIDVSIP